MHTFSNMVWVVPILFVYIFKKIVVVYGIFPLIIQDKSSTKECTPTPRSIENEMLNATPSIDSIAERSVLSIESCSKNSTTQNKSYSKNEMFGSNIKEKDEQTFCEIKSPTYTIYKDADVELSAKNGNMPKELQDCLIHASFKHGFSGIFASIQQKAN